MNEIDPRLSRSANYELSEDTPSNPLTAPTIGDVIAARFGRRDLLRGALATTAVAALGPPALLSSTSREAMAATTPPGFDFPELPAGISPDHKVAEGYDADILLRWGDPVLPGAPEFDPMNQSAEAQEQQFGYNNDFLGYVPLPPLSDNPDHGLLVVNHEYTNEEIMFPDFTEETEWTVGIEMAATGGTVVEIKKDADGKWQPLRDGKYNRRISARSTEMAISGPAAGHDRMKTSADPSGTRVIGTINNCAGGITPWGTYLMAEENFHGYFIGAEPSGREAQNHKRYGVPGGWWQWGKFERRFNIDEEPNEPNRFGWMVEVDVLDPRSTPVKRTAMGRFKHEGAETIVNGDGRVVCYMGDDQRFDYLYKFVTHGRFDPNDRDANRDLLDSGLLFVARFQEDGRMRWLPLVFGHGPLTPENGFESQADVLIETRRAADLVGATPMDRPEDVQPNPTTGKVYVMLTNNSKRQESNAANPRSPNPHGHILELTPDDGDHGALTARWDIMVRCGDPNDPGAEAMWNPATSQDGWFTDPDNAAVDGRGRLWIATDGNKPGSHSNRCDGLWAMETHGDGRGTGRHFFQAPVGAELCGPRFTPDDRTLFVAVQHPADAGVENWPEFGRKSTFEDPATRWPDFQEGMPPRPSVLAINRKDGGPIGG